MERAIFRTFPEAAAMPHRPAPFARRASLHFAVLLSLALAAVVQLPEARRLLPSQAEQERARQLMCEVHGAELDAADTPAKRQAFSKKLIAQAKASATTQPLNTSSSRPPAMWPWSPKTARRCWPLSRPSARPSP